MVNQTCVGCGVCEERCPTEDASIEVIPRKKWKPRKT
ncbi:MAG: 4Fe-4S binding protein [SAR324 cluster bacterium]|nr:4Fe-4S binding protein [SAR324 cluster bacterium]